VLGGGVRPSPGAESLACVAPPVFTGARPCGGLRALLNTGCARSADLCAAGDGRTPPPRTEGLPSAVRAPIANLCIAAEYGVLCLVAECARPRAQKGSLASLSPYSPAQQLAKCCELR